jgi:hypothetical protein
MIRTMQMAAIERHVGRIAMRIEPHENVRSMRISLACRDA